jgi:hypothetical protein
MLSGFTSGEERRFKGGSGSSTLAIVILQEVSRIGLLAPVVWGAIATGEFRVVGVGDIPVVVVPAVVAGETAVGDGLPRLGLTGDVVGASAVSGLEPAVVGDAAFVEGDGNGVVVTGAVPRCIEAIMAPAITASKIPPPTITYTFCIALRSNSR